ncbi:MAG: hypothetical protein WC312_05970 [Candidatus Omnitrophota bacterium]
MNKKKTGEIAELRRHMGVLVEGLRSEIKVVAEQHGGIVNRLDNIDNKLGVMELDLNAIKGALFTFSHKLDNHEGRIYKLESSK